MNKSTFTKLPAVNEKDFINGSNPPPKGSKKTKGLCLKVPESRWHELHELMDLTGLTMNALCNEFIRVGIKEKMKDLKEDY